MKGKRNMYEVNEKDWKILRKKVPVWQENYMEKLNKEYIQLLQRNEQASTNFWDLEKRIFKDRRRIGVVIDMRRSRMIENILELLYDEVIEFNDLEEFSDELKEMINSILSR